MAYSKYEWSDGEIISASDMNRIEEGIETTEDEISELDERVETLETAATADTLSFHTAGFLTGSKLAVYFTIPWSVPYGADTPTLTLESLTIRQDGNYLLGTSSDTTSSGYSTSYAYRGNSFFDIHLTLSSANSDAVNNSTIGISGYFSVE